MATTTRRASRVSTTKSRWADIEEYLEKRGVSWEFATSVKMDEVDFEQSLRNQARVSEQLNEAKVEEYAEAYKRGDVFPPPIVHEVGSKLVMIDGNHRYAGARKAGLPSLAMFVVAKRTRAATIVMMTFEANTKHGLPTSESDRIQQAIWLVENGLSRKDAAAQLNVRYNALVAAYAKLQVEQRATDAGILLNEWEAIMTSSRSRLVTITTDEVLREATKLVYQANLGFPIVQDVVSQLNQLRSVKTQMEYLKHLRDDVYAEAISENASGTLTIQTSKRAMSERQRFAVALGSLVAMPDLGKVASLYVGAERAEAAAKIRGAVERLTTLAEKLENE